MKKAKYKKAFSVALQPEVFERIKAITDEHEISMAEWFREAVNAALQNDTKVGCDE